MARNDDDRTSVVVQAFARRPLSTEQWLEHFNNNVQPLIQQHFQLDSQVSHGDEGSFRILASDSNDAGYRVVAKAFPMASTQIFAKCQTLCKSTVFAAMEQKAGIEHTVQPTQLIALHRDAPGLAVFDMDSTLIQQEVIDELARAVGLYDQVAAITEAAMRGEPPYTDFEASLRARVALLNGVPTTIWAQLKTSTITFTPGAKDLVRALKALGWKTAVLSGGFTPLAEWVKESLGLDYAHANHLVTDEQKGILTGQLVEGQPIIHAEKKRELLLQIAALNQIPPERAIAVGDGSNDLLMMGAAGLGVAFNAKPKVQLAAPVRLNSKTLLDVMHILGYTQEEVRGLLNRTA